ncbi:unnamed protein product, partial [marine sediment metagenome]
MLKIQEGIIPLAILSSERLKSLESWGMLLDSSIPEKVRFIADPIRDYLDEFFLVGKRTTVSEDPKDVRISLIQSSPQTIMTIFRTDSTGISIDLKPVLSEVKRDFMENFSRYLSYLFNRLEDNIPVLFGNLRDVGNNILAQFTTGDIRRYLVDPAMGSTIDLEIHDSLKSIPWELMLETAYAGEIPFRVGRKIIGLTPQTIRSVIRGNREKVEALLIADPTDDLKIARDEVVWLDKHLNDIGFFKPTVLKGSKECKMDVIRNELASENT